MSSWFSSLFTGKNKTLDQNIPLFGQEAGFAQGQGQGDVNAASQWYQSLLSGDPTREAEAIAPETAALNESAQSKKNEMAEFSPRSGGTAAAAAGMDEKTRSDLIKLIGGLKSGAASGAASLGTSEQDLALNAQQLQDAASQQQLMNWKDSIFGKGLADVSQTALNAAEGWAGL